MKPPDSAPGSPFDFNLAARFLIPDLWNEKKPMRFRGVGFVFSYLLSALIYFSAIILPICFILSRPVWPSLVLIFCSGAPFGVMCGLAAWWDFNRRKFRGEE